MIFQQKWYFNKCCIKGIKLCWKSPKEKKIYVIINAMVAMEVYCLGLPSWGHVPKALSHYPLGNLLCHSCHNMLLDNSKTIDHFPSIARMIEPQCLCPVWDTSHGKSVLLNSLKAWTKVSDFPWEFLLYLPPLSLFTGVRPVSEFEAWPEYFCTPFL